MTWNHRKNLTAWNKGLNTKELGKSRPKVLYQSRECLECGTKIFTYPSVNRRFCNMSCRSKTTARLYPKKDIKTGRVSRSAFGRTLCVACHYYITFKRKMPMGHNSGQ